MSRLDAVNSQITCLHDQNKSVFFGGPAFFSTNQGFFKTFQIAMIGWIKFSPPKKLLLFDHVNKLLGLGHDAD